ncbi:hypothetical protein Mal4_53940 [Maioricimonas rarisocia]|uniref:DUF115 domain-containing protein n=1 Tax=Maioricimonas rarisocia TaxID=2528026 RepID=A0A517ZF22_9PLAN|nr:hypothetical protein [Maioricimonas rarisocia]QDU41029.1 hypothetical protein Mal4_53940 [Maioricimonas rarisocia]
MFFRLETDGTQQDVELEGLYSGPFRSACWIIGGGPSLDQLPVEAIAHSPVPRFGINLAGSSLLRPTFWTSYDPTARFHRSIYLDAGITKFVHRRRAMDLVPETTFKVCECPNTLFFDRSPDRGFHNYLSGPGITDWQDTFIQAVGDACRLGFRTLYLAGCDMFIEPSCDQQRFASVHGVEYRPRELLRDFFARCRQAGLTDERMQLLAPPRQYHFDEVKPLDAASNTDWHYFRVVQYLRLSRRALARAGLELISVTPASRLNDHFEYRPVEQVLDDIRRSVGDPERESTRGRYTSTAARQAAALGPMRDFRPHNWSAPAAPEKKPVAEEQPDRRDARERVRQVLDDVPEVPVAVNEDA